MTEDRRRTGVPDAANLLREAREQLQQAEQLRQERKFDRAEALCVALVRRHPDYFGALHTLGLICAEKGDHHRAMGFLSRAAMLNPRSWMTLTALSGVYLELGAKEMAARTLEQARAVNPQDPAILVTLGEIYREEREYGLARNAYREALEFEPGMAAAAIGLAESLAALGDYADAASVLEGLIRREGPTIGTLASLVDLPASVIGMDVLAAVERVKPPDGMIRSEFDATTLFIRAAALHNKKRYSEAWESLVAANRIAFGPLQKDLARSRASQERILASVRDNAIRAPSGGKAPISLFIFGPSRSGKSTLESLASTIDGVQRGYENPSVENAISRTFQVAGLLTNWSMDILPPLFYPQFRKIYLEELHARAGSARVFTNTHPTYLHEAARLAATLPNVRFLFVKRNVDDNLLRILMRKYHRGNAYAYDIGAARDHIAWYHQMMDALAAKLGSICRTLTYEDVVADPSSALQAIADLCGLAMPDGDLPGIGDDRGCAGPYRQFLDDASPPRS